MQLDRRSMLGWMAAVPVGFSVLRWRPPRRKVTYADLLLRDASRRGDFVFDVATGRASELFDRIRRGNPVDCALEYIILRTVQPDEPLRRCRTVEEILSLDLTEEVRSGNYIRQSFTGSSLQKKTDHARHAVDFSTPDVTWMSISGDIPWTDLVTAYAPNWMESSDRDLVPLTKHAFFVEPDGSNITAQLDAKGLFSCK